MEMSSDKKKMRMMPKFRKRRFARMVAKIVAAMTPMFTKNRHRAILLSLDDTNVLNKKLYDQHLAALGDASDDDGATPDE